MKKLKKWQIALLVVVFCAVIGGVFGKKEPEPTSQPVDEPPVSQPTEEPSDENTEPPVADDVSQSEEAAALDEECKQTLKSLYEELVNECAAQTESYDDTTFVAFLADWNARRTEAQTKFAKASVDYKIALADLIYLETELKNKVLGKEFDQKYIDTASKSIERLIY